MLRRLFAIFMTAVLACTTAACGLFGDAFDRFSDKFEGSDNYTLAMTVQIPDIDPIRSVMTADGNLIQIEYPDHDRIRILQFFEYQTWCYVLNRYGVWTRGKASADDLDLGPFAPFSVFARADFTEDPKGVYVLDPERLDAYGVTSMCFKFEDGVPTATLTMEIEGLFVLATVAITAIGSSEVILPEEFARI